MLREIGKVLVMNNRSQIKATQAEIKELEKSIQGKKRKRHGGRHQ